MGRPRKPEHEKAPRVYPSGASKRKKRYELEGLIAQQAEDSGDAPKDDGVWAEDFRKAGKPDIDNPETDLSYTRRLQLIVLYQMATTPFPTVAQGKVWRSIKDMSATVGMTSSKAALESTVKKLRKQIETKAQAATVLELPGSSIAKPSTARGGARGPRIIPDDVPDPERLPPG